MLMVVNQNVLSAPGEILVCPTNTVGVMGAGLAKYVRDNVAGVYNQYRQYCKEGKHTLELPLYFNEQKVLCLATKQDWRDPSSLALIKKSVNALNLWLVRHEEPLSLNLPLLGGGNGRYQVRGYKKTIAVDYSKDDALDTIVETIKVPMHHCVYLCI